MESQANVEQDYINEQMARKTSRLIFLGVTGHGKTTMIQSIIDYQDGHSYEERGNLNLDGPSLNSQTQDIKEVTLGGQEWIIKVIDTPGLADTGGRKKDIEHFDELAKFLAENASFNAICFVIKNGSCRLTPELNYAFKKLKELFPKYNDNFFVVLTYSEELSHSQDTDAVIKGLISGLPPQNIFYINNISYQQYVDHSEEQEELNNCYYSETTNEIKRLLEVSSKLEPFISDGKIWLEKRKFSLLCEIAEEIIKRDSTFYETAQIQDMQQKVTQQLISESDCKIKRVAMRDYGIGEETSAHVVCLICSKFCRKVMTFETKKEIDFSNCLVQSYKEQIKVLYPNPTIVNKMYVCATLIPSLYAGLRDLVYRDKCRNCNCPPVYHAKFGKINQEEYQNNNEIDQTIKFGKRLIIQEDANIFSGSDFKDKMNQELKNLEAKRNQCQGEIQKKYELLNKLKLIGAPFVYQTTIELEMKKMPAIPDWLKDLVQNNNGEQHHLETSMDLKHKFIKQLFNKECKPFLEQEIQDKHE